MVSVRSRTAEHSRTAPDWRRFAARLRMAPDWRTLAASWIPALSRRPHSARQPHIPPPHRGNCAPISRPRRLFRKLRVSQPIHIHYKSARPHRLRRPPFPNTAPRWRPLPLRGPPLCVPVKRKCRCVQPRVRTAWPYPARHARAARRPARPPRAGGPHTRNRSAPYPAQRTRPMQRTPAAGKLEPTKPLWPRKQPGRLSKRRRPALSDREQGRSPALHWPAQSHQPKAFRRRSPRAYAGTD